MLEKVISFMKTCLKGGHVLQVDISSRRTSLAGGHVLWEVGHVWQKDMSYSKTYNEVTNVLHNDMSSEVLVECNHASFFLKSFGLPLISGICAEAATNYAAVS